MTVADQSVDERVWRSRPVGAALTHGQGLAGVLILLAKRGLSA